MSNYDELKAAAQPLVEYIRKKYTPMTTVIVTGAGVEVLSTEVHVPFFPKHISEDSKNGKFLDHEEKSITNPQK
mgnify:CR=1 FL=1|jgi:hypothetical protein|nr:MAG TPA: hypothetical protein [Caudoviricetes sp.]